MHLCWRPLWDTHVWPPLGASSPSLLLGATCHTSDGAEHTFWSSGAVPPAHSPWEWASLFLPFRSLIRWHGQWVKASCQDQDWSI